MNDETAGDRPLADPTPRREAVALRYQADDLAPTVVAKGYGDIAETIMARAQEHELAVHADPDLVRLLMQVDLDAHIPPALYQAVAELLAWLYELDTALREKRHFSTHSDHSTGK